MNPSSGKAKEAAVPAKKKVIKSKRYNKNIKHPSFFKGNQQKLIEFLFKKGLADDFKDRFNPIINNLRSIIKSTDEEHNSLFLRTFFSLSIAAASGGVTVIPSVGPLSVSIFNGIASYFEQREPGSDIYKLTNANVYIASKLANLFLTHYESTDKLFNKLRNKCVDFDKILQEQLQKSPNDLDKNYNEIKNLFNEVIDSAIKLFFKENGYLFCACPSNGELVISKTENKYDKFLRDNGIVFNISMTKDEQEIFKKLPYGPNIVVDDSNLSSKQKEVKEKFNATKKYLEDIEKLLEHEGKGEELKTGRVKGKIKEIIDQYEFLSVAFSTFKRSDSKDELDEKLTHINNSIKDLIRYDQQSCEVINKLILKHNFTSKEFNDVPLLKDEYGNWSVLKLEYEIEKNPGKILSSLLLDTNPAGKVAEERLKGVLKKAAIECKDINEVIEYGKELGSFITSKLDDPKYSDILLRLNVLETELRFLFKEANIRKNVQDWILNIIGLKDRDPATALKAAIRELTEYKTHNKKLLLKDDRDVLYAVNILAYIFNKLDAKDTSLKDVDAKRVNYVLLGDEKNYAMRRIISFEVNKRNDIKIGNDIIEEKNECIRKNYDGEGFSRFIQDFNQRHPLNLDASISTNPPDINKNNEREKKEQEEQYKQYLPIYSKINDVVQKLKKYVKQSREDDIVNDKDLQEFLGICGKFENVEKKLLNDVYLSSYGKYNKLLEYAKEFYIQANSSKCINKLKGSKFRFVIENLFRTIKFLLDKLAAIFTRSSQLLTKQRPSTKQITSRNIAGKLQDIKVIKRDLKKVVNAALLPDNDVSLNNQAPSSNSKNPKIHGAAKSRRYSI